MINEGSPEQPLQPFKGSRLYLIVFLLLHFSTVMAAPKVNVVLKPKLSGAQYYRSVDSNEVIASAMLTGQRGEVISNTLIELSHPCLKTAKSMSNFSGMVMIKLGATTQSTSQRCTRFLETLRSLPSLEVTFSTPPVSAHQSDKIQPTLSWKVTSKDPSKIQRYPDVIFQVRVKSSLVNSAATFDQSFSYSPEQLEVTPVSLPTFQETSLSTRIDLTLQSYRVGKRRVLTPLQEELTFTAKLISHPSEPKSVITQVTQRIEPSSKQTGELHFPLQLSDLTDVSIQLDIFIKERLVLQAESTEIILFPRYRLEVNKYSMNRLRSEITLSGQVLTPTGTDDRTLSPQLEISWRHRDTSSDLPSVGQKEAWQTRRLKLNQDRTWSQRFRLPTNQEIQFRIQLYLPYVTDPQQRPLTLPCGSPYLTPWIATPTSWWWTIGWVLIACFVLILSQLRRSPSIQSNSSQYKTEQADVSAGWMSTEHLKTFLNPEAMDYNGVPKLLIIHAFTLQPIEGMIRLVSTPPIFSSPDYHDRLKSLEQCHQVTDVPLTGCPLMRPPDHTTRSFSLWVSAAGFEPLLIQLPIYDDQAAKTFILPLWPLREAVGRMWEATLKVSGISARFGSTPQTRLHKALARHNDPQLLQLFQEVHRLLYRGNTVSYGAFINLRFALSQTLTNDGQPILPRCLLPPSDQQQNTLDQS